MEGGIYCCASGILATLLLQLLLLQPEPCTSIVDPYLTQLYNSVYGQVACCATGTWTTKILLQNWTSRAVTTLIWLTICDTEFHACVKPPLVMTKRRHSGTHSVFCPKFKKLDEPKNNVKYTQVYAEELVVSGIWQWGDWSSHSCQTLCWIVKHVSKISSS